MSNLTWEFKLLYHIMAHDSPLFNLLSHYKLAAYNSKFAFGYTCVQTSSTLQLNRQAISNATKAPMYVSSSLKYLTWVLLLPSRRLARHTFVSGTHCGQSHLPSFVTSLYLCHSFRGRCTVSIFLITNK